MPRKKLDKSKWLRLETSNGIVYCSDATLKDTKKKLKNNKIKIIKEYFVDRFDIDLPGPILQDRLWEDFRLGGVDIGVPLHCLTNIISELKLAAPQNFSNKKQYYALHYTFNFVIFNLEERQMFIDILEALPDDIFELSNKESEKLTAALNMLSHVDSKNTLPN